jgi:hypothetical protein
MGLAASLLLRRSIDVLNWRRMLGCWRVRMFVSLSFAFGRRRT